MKSRKGVTLSFPVIVGAIIAILVLVLLVSYTTGSLTKLFGETQPLQDISETEILAAKTKCQNWCFEAKNLDSLAEWKESDFCKRKQPLGDSLVFCNNDLIDSKCTVQVVSGNKIYSCTQDQQCGGMATDCTEVK